jgi:glycosyltransferase involved in cell wall biosynthesis
MKRVLIWFWSGGGGGSRFAVDLAARLGAHTGQECVWLSLRADDPQIARARALGLEVRAAEVQSDRQRPLATALGLAHAARVLAAHARGADIVVVPMNFAMAAPLAFTLKQKLVYCAHDPAPHPGDYARLLQRVTQSILMSRAAALVALSEFSRQTLARMGQHYARVAPLSSVLPPKPPSGVRAEGPTRLLFAGRMITYKGGDLLADALPQIADRADWRLTVTGAGPALTRALAARFACPQLELLDASWLSDENLERHIEACDILLAPYRSATQSGLVAQALAHGKPCVVTPVGALAEQIGGGKAGWIAKSASASDFAAALVSALDDAQGRADKSQNAIHLAREAWRSDYWSWITRLE